MRTTPFFHHFWVKNFGDAICNIICQYSASADRWLCCRSTWKRIKFVSSKCNEFLMWDTKSAASRAIPVMESSVLSWVKPLPRQKCKLILKQPFAHFWIIKAEKWLPSRNFVRCHQPFAILSLELHFWRISMGWLLNSERQLFWSTQVTARHSRHTTHFPSHCWMFRRQCPL